MVFAQTPTHYPTGSDPMEFTIGNILVYIVFPVLLFVFWFFVRRKRKGKQDVEKSD